MKTIDEDIKSGQLKHVYLLFGDERYLLLQYRDKLINALTGREDTMNFTRFEGEETDSAEVVDLAETLPFFSDKRLLLIENSSFFKDNPDRIVEYMSEIPETTYFIFCEKSIDKRGRLYKAIAKNGSAIDFSTMDERTIQTWIVSRFKKEGKQLSAQTLNLFLSRTGSDMGTINMEMEKVISYTGERPVITDEDIRAITSTRIEDKVFEMIDAISVCNQTKALSLYYDLLTLKVAAVKTLNLIARHYKILLTVKSMSSASYNDIAKKAGVASFFVKKYIAQCKNYTLADLKNILEELADLDYAFKRGNLDEQIAVELFIIRHSQ
ncbi:MAG: DNA polymerase III subunit delta [Agathobacter sp.]|uniref:DNA polymerase III subunit delta n=1 Tax=Agathobacter sp. TaxID=2021311 RepID=UPI00257ECE90|nr:DNA polymerase III subunit delta [Agathobacter sp.]MBQ1681667.1 DNA polymerase III subunit delta [Agathobacter sp.]MCR5678436.1 DNA polymerase III subunit delta [Agathobacter sp.]